MSPKPLISTKVERVRTERVNDEGSPRVIKVLMYHRIVDTEQLSRTHWTCVHTQEFRRHLQLLDHWGFTAITFDDYRLYLAGELNLPRKPVILTFDDGYLDVYKNAFPILKEFGMKAVVFVLGNREIKKNFWDEPLGLPTASLMGEQEILELHAAGFEIGSHTMNHAALTMLSEEEAWEEISRSRMVLEILVNSSVRTFCYPYGNVNGSIKKMVEDAGYTVACSVYTGPATFGIEPFETRRITIPGALGTIGFGIRLSAPYLHYNWVRWKVKCALIGLGREHLGMKETRSVPSYTRWR
jgi:peptidoglycan/xylan/chitin deacetylase (PgdA/CDA1 family)